MCGFGEPPERSGPGDSGGAFRGFLVLVLVVGVREE